MVLLCKVMLVLYPAVCAGCRSPIRYNHLITNPKCSRTADGRWRKLTLDRHTRSGGPGHIG